MCAQIFRFLLPAFFFVLYFLTAQHGVSWGDSGLFQYRVMIHDYVGNGGLACAHPLYILVGTRLLDVLPTEWWFRGLNVLSGFFASLTLYFLGRSARLLGASEQGERCAVITLGFSHILWSMSTLAEVYTLSLFFLSLEVYAGLRFLKGKETRWFVLMCLCNGLHLTVHNFALLNLPVYTVLAYHLLATRRVKSVLLAACVWLVGASLTLWLGVTDYLAHGDLWGTIQNLFVGNYQSSVMGTASRSRALVLMNVMLMGLTFCLPLYAYGVWFYAKQLRLFKGRRDLQFVAALFCVQFLFWVRYAVPDQWTFVLPTLFLLTLLFSYAAGNLRSEKMFLVSTVLLAVVLPWGICHFSHLLPKTLTQARTHVVRDNLRYFVLPWKHTDRTAEDFVASVTRTVPKDALIYADFTNITPLASVRHLEMLSKRTLEAPFYLADKYYSQNKTPEHPTAVYEVHPFGPYRTSPETYTINKKDGPLYLLNTTH